MNLWRVVNNCSHVGKMYLINHCFIVQDSSPGAGVLYVSCQLLFVKFANLIYRHGTYHDQFASRDMKIFHLKSFLCCVWLLRDFEFPRCITLDNSASDSPSDVPSEGIMTTVTHFFWRCNVIVF